MKFNGTAFTQVLSEKLNDVNYSYEKMMSYDNNIYVSRSKPYDDTYLYQTTDFKTFTCVATGSPLCVYNNDLYILGVDNDTNIRIRTLSLNLKFGINQSQSLNFTFPKNIINGIQFCNDYGRIITISYGGLLVPINGNYYNYNIGGAITNLTGNKYYTMDSHNMYEYTLNLKSTVKPNTLILYEYGNNGRNQINLYTDKYENLKLGFNRAFYYGQSGMVWDAEIYVPYNNNWLKIQSY